jgi:anti-anti-sigma factor
LTVTEAAASFTLSVSAGTHGRIRVLSLRGELDERSVETFASAIWEVSTADCDAVLLDLTHLYRLDEAGLAALGDAAASLARAGRRLSMASIRPRIREFLAFSGADALMPSFRNVDQALGQLRLVRVSEV